jgi:hypothetical protein
VNPSEILSIVFCALAGTGLLLIQVRKIINGELPLFGGIEAFKKASRVDLDHYDKALLWLSGISFILFLICICIRYA